MLKHFAFALFTLISLNSLAQSTDQLPQTEATSPAPTAADLSQNNAEKFLASLKFQTGKIKLPNGIATLDLPANFRYLSPDDSKNY